MNAPCGSSFALALRFGLDERALWEFIRPCFALRAQVSPKAEARDGSVDRLLAAFSSPARLHRGRRNRRQRGWDLQRAALCALGRDVQEALGLRTAG